MIIIRLQKFKYLGYAFTVDRKYDSEIQNRIGIAKDVFKKLTKFSSIKKDRYYQGKERANPIYYIYFYMVENSGHFRQRWMKNLRQQKLFSIEWYREYHWMSIQWEHCKENETKIALSIIIRKKQLKSLRQNKEWKLEKINLPDMSNAKKNSELPISPACVNEWRKQLWRE